MKTPFCLSAFVCCTVAMAHGQEPARSLIYSGNYQNGAFESLTFVNSVVGWDLFFNSGFRGGSSVIGNLEAGQIWSGHEAFVRQPGAPGGILAWTNPAMGALNQLDYHATTVGHVLAGSGYVDQNGSPGFTYVGLGMAPEARVVSGGIATEFSSTAPGSFSITQQSMVTAYRDFFQGNNLAPGVSQLDVINSSWGGGGDASASATESLVLDGLARQNPSVALVLSAGNGGAGGVSSPASGFNNLSVGSLGGPTFLTPSSFSSSGLADFYNPETGITLSGVRAVVDLAAPGESLFLAAYLGNSGSIGAALPWLVQAPLPADQYFLNLDGTSYSAPIVAGGIALLKDVAKTDASYHHLGNADAFDTRVIKSVLMAGSKETEGWNNGQNAMNVTTQALDVRTGAGALDLVAAADVYFFGTRELATDGGGVIANAGWDSATIDLGSTFEYRFATEFTQAMALTVALNWFSVRDFNNPTDGGVDLAFANLDLQVWSLDSGGQFLAKVGESSSTYNNTEFLRLDSLVAGRYGLRVLFGNLVFDTTNEVVNEYYGLAWQAVAVPEHSCFAFLAAALGLLSRRKRLGSE